LVSAASNGSSPITAFKKQLYTINPANPPQFVQIQRTRKKQRSVAADPKSLERQVRQALADKTSDNQIGICLLLPEHLRLGTWISCAHGPAGRVCHAFKSRAVRK